MKNHLQNIRLTKEQADRIKEKADKEGKTISDFIRERIDAEPYLIQKMKEVLENVITK